MLDGVHQHLRLLPRHLEILGQAAFLEPSTNSQVVKSGSEPRGGRVYEYIFRRAPHQTDKIPRSINMYGPFQMFLPIHITQRLWGDNSGFRYIRYISVSAVQCSAGRKVGKVPESLTTSCNVIHSRCPSLSKKANGRASETRPYSVQCGQLPPRSRYATLVLGPLPWRCLANSSFT